MSADPSSPYSAPALEKGLDILELLARSGQPMATRQIAESLGRSKNELFRMLHVLLARGYLQRDPQSETFSLTNALFDLGIRTTMSRDLVSVAAPLIGQLADEARQAAHLVVAHRGETVIVAASSGGADLSFALKLGYRRPLLDAHSGLTLLAHQSSAQQARMIAEARALMTAPPDPAALGAQLQALRDKGEMIAESRDIIGLTDLCCPILGPQGHALACVTLVAVSRRSAPPDFAAMMQQIRRTCARIREGMNPAG